MYSLSYILHIDCLQKINMQCVIPNWNLLTENKDKLLKTCLSKQQYIILLTEKYNDILYF